MNQNIQAWETRVQKEHQPVQRLTININTEKEIPSKCPKTTKQRKCPKHKKRDKRSQQNNDPLTNSSISRTTKLN